MTSATGTPMWPRLPLRCSIRTMRRPLWSPARRARPQPGATTSIATMSPSVSSTHLRTSSRQHSASPASTSFARWHVSMCAPRRRPRRFCSSMAATFPISSNATSMRSRCRGWRMWRGSSGRGSTPITQPTRNRWTHRVLAAIPAARLADTIWTPHPATRIVRSQFPAIAIFAANRSDGPVGPIAATEPEDALVTRPALEVMVRRLPPGGAVFLARLIAGESLGATAVAALAETSDFDLPAKHRRHARGGSFHCHPSWGLRRWLRDGRSPATTDGMGSVASWNGRTRSFAPLLSRL